MRQQYQSLRLVAGANLNRLIKENGMTQMQAANLLRYSDSRCIRRLIHDGIKNIDDIQRIANIFGVPFDEMVMPLD